MGENHLKHSETVFVGLHQITISETVFVGLHQMYESHGSQRDLSNSDCFEHGAPAYGQGTVPRPLPNAWPRHMH